MEITDTRPPGDLTNTPSSSSLQEQKALCEHEQEVSSDTNEACPPPTAEESQTLRRVAGSLPLVSFSLCLVEFAERASYYGANTVFANFTQFPLPKGRPSLNLIDD